MPQDLLNCVLRTFFQTFSTRFSSTLVVYIPIIMDTPLFKISTNYESTNTGEQTISNMASILWHNIPSLQAFRQLGRSAKNSVIFSRVLSHAASQLTERLEEAVAIETIHFDVTKQLSHIKITQNNQVGYFAPDPPFSLQPSEVLQAKWNVKWVSNAQVQRFTY